MKKLLFLLVFIPLVSFGQTAEEYTKSGYEKVEMGDLYGAIEDYTKAIKINPRNSTLYYNRGTIKVTLKEYYDAIQDFQKAVEIKPNFADAYNSLGNAVLAFSEWADRNISDSNLRDKTMELSAKEAISYYNKAIQIDWNNAYAYANRANAKLKYLKDFQGAIIDYTKAIEIDDDIDVGILTSAAMKTQIEYAIMDRIAIYYYRRGAAKYYLGDLTEACKDFKKSSELLNNSASKALAEYCN